MKHPTSLKLAGAAALLLANVSWPAMAQSATAMLKNDAGKDVGTVNWRKPQAACC